MPGRLEGKVVFITGAARGQGRAHAVRFAEEGANVIATDLRPPEKDEAFAETVQLVEATGRKIIALAADVRELPRLREAAAAATSFFGRLDIVIANAGVVSISPTLETAYDEWQLAVDVNLTGVFLTAQATIPRILEGGRGGSFLITSSTQGIKAGPRIAAYAATKHGCVGLMKVLALEFAPAMVRVNTVHPTTVDTEMLESIYPDGDSRSEAAEKFRKVNALPIPWVEPRDVSNAMVFLASDDGRYITGAQLTVDAGAVLLGSAG